MTPEKVDAVIRRLVQVARPKRIILFGSYVSGRITEDSDLDVLVVTGDELENTRRESVRLRHAVRDIDMPMDILVVRESAFQQLGDIQGLIYEEARRSGRLVYELQS